MVREAWIEHKHNLYRRALETPAIARILKETPSEDKAWVACNKVMLVGLVNLFILKGNDELVSYASLVVSSSAGAFFASMRPKISDESRKKELTFWVSIIIMSGAYCGISDLNSLKLEKLKNRTLI